MGEMTTYSQMAGLTTRVAASASSAAAQPQSWAISLDVAESLAVVALLRWIHCQTLFLNHKSLL